MSQTPEAPPAAEARRLGVQTGDAQSEILVLDARGRFVERSFGPEHSFELERGIYRVKVLTGAESQEKPVVLAERPTEFVSFAPISFASPVPLAGTSTSHEYHELAASQESRQTRVKDGAGSSIFCMVRDWTPDRQPERRRRITGDPATGLSLHAAVNGRDREVADLAKAGKHSLEFDAWSACTVSVNPGVYELRLVLPTGATLHQSIVASPQWQTQAFVFMRGYSASSTERSAAPREWRADLARTSIVMARDQGFSFDEPALRRLELVRVALANRRAGEPAGTARRLLPEEVRTMLRDKCDDPMLGIYAAHLLLLEPNPDFSLFRRVVGQLRGLLGTSHPDVEALALRAEGEPPPAPFEFPPMLARSWSLIVDATADRPDLVSDPLSARVTNDLWSEGPWHIWRTPPAQEAADSQDSGDLSGFEEALAENLGLMRQVRRARLPQVYSEAAADPAAPKAILPKALDVEERGRGAARMEAVEIDADRLRSIARRFGLPQSQLRTVISTLEEKLRRLPNAPDTKVILK